jgi:hypothetical protein
VKNGRAVDHTTCPFCGAAPGQPCRTRYGNQPKESTHAARWNHYRLRVLTEHMIFEMREDDERFGLKKGDVLLCIDYPLDAKVTVLRRLSDGYDPRCNQYIESVKFIGFAEDMATDIV